MKSALAARGIAPRTEGLGADGVYWLHFDAGAKAGSIQPACRVELTETLASSPCSFGAIYVCAISDAKAQAGMHFDAESCEEAAAMVEDILRRDLPDKRP